MGPILAVAESRFVKKHGRENGWLECNGKRYWVGTADPFGLLIYDPEEQAGLRPNRVNLFIVNQHRTASFVVDGGVRDIVRAAEHARAECARAVAEYAEARASSPRAPVSSPSTASRRRASDATARRQGRRWPRETHCWSCKEPLGAGDFPVCERCGGMRCSCGACFCDYVGLG